MDAEGGVCGVVGKAPIISEIVIGARETRINLLWCSGFGM